MKIKIKDILEIASKLGKISIYTLEILSLGQSRSYRNLRRAVLDPFYFERIQAKKIQNNPEEKRRKYQNFANLLAYLQKQGLVEKYRNKGDKASYWTITGKGKKKLENLKEKTKNDLPKEIYKIEKGNGFNIIIFDIPETERRGRNWLRFNLLALGFQKLQKSVWIGNNKLPIEFLDNLKDLGLFSYVEIFSVNKFGTVKDTIKDIKEQRRE